MKILLLLFMFTDTISVKYFENSWKDGYVVVDTAYIMNSRLYYSEPLLFMDNRRKRLTKKFSYYFTNL